MNNYKAERTAIYAVASVFTDYGWVFREQPIVDYGVDALVETSINGFPSGKFIALQIKGGSHNFHRKEECLTFYFSERHYLYWKAISETFPLFILLHDPSTDAIYWEHFTMNNVVKTQKCWKIEVPLSNILDNNSKIKIQLITDQSVNKPSSYIKESFLRKSVALDEVHFRYFRFPRKTDSLHCEIYTSSESVTINLKYRPSRKNWDEDNSSIIWQDPYYFALVDLERNIRTEYSENIKKKINKPILKATRSIQEVLKSGGIEKVAELIFDTKNGPVSVPKCQYFIQAFEQYSKLKKGQYQAEILDHLIIFRVKSNQFEMNTYEGKIAELKDFIKRRSYDEIYTQTDESIWGEIYIDCGIEKKVFIPQMHSEWEIYWDELYGKIEREIGYTSHLDKKKERSWREFNSFVNTYNDAANIIELAYDFDDMILYTLAVITMLKVFNADVCYEEYCEHEFYASNEWETICIDNEDQYKPIFHIRERDF